MKEFDNLESFLEHVSLATSVDQEWEGEKINMMTMHAAKGLEFDAVFLPGWEGLVSSSKINRGKGQNGLEEERRLAYVGITRAKKNAKISFSMNRFYQGDWIDSMASRFIDELPEKYLEKIHILMKELKKLMTLILIKILIWKKEQEALDGLDIKKELNEQKNSNLKKKI